MVLGDFEGPIDPRHPFYALSASGSTESLSPVKAASREFHTPIYASLPIILDLLGSSRHLEIEKRHGRVRSGIPTTWVPWWTKPRPVALANGQSARSLSDTARGSL